MLKRKFASASSSVWSSGVSASLIRAQSEIFGPPAQAARLDEVLYNLAESCRVLAVLLNPFLPGTSAKIYAQLNLTGTPDKLADATWGGLVAGHTIGEPAPLFPRKDV